ncbi:hypothetical protein HK096_006049 [Nowakowskiella sp. JEL0078]|nr:hypothetical protein HK096_006049 [Nowakowskiella sp. JEL0078]
MDAFAAFDVLLDKPFFLLDDSLKYCEVSGELFFVLNKVLKDAELINLRFVGGLELTDTSKKSSKLRAIRRIFDQELILWEPSLDTPHKPEVSDDRDPRSPAIIHQPRRFKFRVKFPCEIPASCDSQHHKVKYFVEAAFHHEPMWQMCCGGLRMPILGYRVPDCIRKEIVLCRVPQFDVSAALKSERKIADNLFVKDGENTVYWRPQGGDVEVAISRFLTLRLDGEVSPIFVRVNSRRDCKVLREGKEVSVRVKKIAISFIQREEYELTHDLQMFDEPVELTTKRKVEIEHSLRASFEDSLEDHQLQKDATRLIHEYNFPFCDSNADLKARSIEIIEDFKYESYVEVSHLARVQLTFVISSSKTEHSISKDIPVIALKELDQKKLEDHKCYLEKKRDNFLAIENKMKAPSQPQMSVNKSVDDSDLRNVISIKKDN